MHHEHTKRVTGNFLCLDAQDLTYSVSRIDDEIADGERKLFGIHNRLSESTCMAPPGRFSGRWTSQRQSSPPTEEPGTGEKVGNCMPTIP